MFFYYLDTQRACEDSNAEYNKVYQKEVQMSEQLMTLQSRSDQLKEMERDLRNQTNSTVAVCTELESSLQCSTNSIKELE